MAAPMLLVTHPAHKSKAKALSLRSRVENMTLVNKYSHRWIVNIGLFTMDLKKNRESHGLLPTYKESIKEIKRIKPIYSHIIEACKSRCVCGGVQTCLWLLKQQHQKQQWWWSSDKTVNRQDVTRLKLYGRMQYSCNISAWSNAIILVLQVPVCVSERKVDCVWCK